MVWAHTKMIWTKRHNTTIILIKWIPGTENVSDTISCAQCCPAVWVGWEVGQFHNNERYLSCEYIPVVIIHQCNAQFLTISFSSDYPAGHYWLRGEIEQVFPLQSRCLEGCNGYGLQLLSKHNLKHFHHKFPDEDGLQDEWEAAVPCPSKYVKLLVGQSDEEDLRVERDKENYFDNEYWDQVAKNFFLAIIRPRHMHVGVRQDPMKWSTIKFQVKTCVWF